MVVERPLDLPSFSLSTVGGMGSERRKEAAAGAGGGGRFGLLPRGCGGDVHCSFVTALGQGGEFLRSLQFGEGKDPHSHMCCQGKNRIGSRHCASSQRSDAISGLS